MSGKEYWERHARRYDASTGWLLGKPMARMLDLVSESLQSEHYVLEVAAGTGMVTAAIARSSGEVVATDYAASMVEVLASRVQGDGLDNVICEQADIYALSYKNGQFDVVVAANVLHLVPDIAAAIEALRRVAKPGGTLIVPTFCHDETWVSWIVSRLLAVSGFPGARRFTLSSLVSALQENGVQILRTEIAPGLIPIGFVEASF